MLRWFLCFNPVKNHLELQTQIYNFMLMKKRHLSGKKKQPHLNQSKMIRMGLKFH